VHGPAPSPELDAQVAHGKECVGSAHGQRFTVSGAPSHGRAASGRALPATRRRSG
jgi:hypothetical protein